MWIYEQLTGDLRYDGKVVASGYSGHGEHKNDPSAQSMHNVGPIPVGYYTIGAPHETATHGPYVLTLTPYEQNQMFSRAGFLIHGDSKAEPGAASQGCVIMGRSVREAIWQSNDRTLKVVAGGENNPVADLTGEISV
jgi:hypothetical protein